jgi:hypothetical protein
MEVWPDVMFSEGFYLPDALKVAESSEQGTARLQTAPTPVCIKSARSAAHCHLPSLIAHMSQGSVPDSSRLFLLRVTLRSVL